jgi:hypothetical protein
MGKGKRKQKRAKPCLFTPEEVTRLKTRSGAGPHRRCRRGKKRYRAWEAWEVEG